MPYRFVMIGAGSFFTDAITEGLCRARALFDGSRFVLVDASPERLALSLARNQKIVAESGADIQFESTTDRRRALDGCDYVITACEKERVRYWIQDLEIPRRYGVEQYMGENGGPGGQAHALRNISMFMDICADMRELCPQAWLMNFTNPMSFVCTYFHRYSGVRAVGFCHQVHGSMGVVAEMLGFEPGELQVISGGVNHFNWLLDLRRRSTGESYMETFLARVRRSPYWKKIHKNIPPQKLTLEILNTFGLYPVGYDDHICEYLPFFYPPEQWKDLGYTPRLEGLKKEYRAQRKRQKAGFAQQQQAETRARSEFYHVPFPRDGNHPYYQEQPTEVIEALESGNALPLTSVVIPNNGAIDNLPAAAVVDIPGIVTGGEVRGIHVGPLPPFAMELCRRQITIHELITAAAVEGDRQKIVQAMALDPYVQTMEQARKITAAFLRAYKEELPQFHA